MATYKKLLKNRAGDTIIPVSEYDVYSTSEQVVGVWIDGKPLYERVIKIENAAKGTTTDYPHNIPNINIIFPTDMFVLNKSATYKNVRPINITYNTSTIVSQTNTIQISYRIPTDLWGWETSDLDLYVIVRYTKTTD